MTDFYFPQSALNERGRIATLDALKKRYEGDALNALKRAALTEDENQRTYELNTAVRYIKDALGVLDD